MAVTKEQVRDTYRRHFEATKDSAEAHNRTLDELAPIFSREMPEAEFEERHRIARLILDVQRAVETEAGDPFWRAVDDAVKSLKRDDVLGAVHETWATVVKQVSEEVRRAKKNPKTWSPRELPLDPKEPPKSLEDALAQIEGPYLYVMFDDKGNLDGWTIDYPDYWRGHGGPVAAVPISSDTTWEDIEREIADEFGQADIDFEEEGEEA